MPIYFKDDLLLYKYLTTKQDKINKISKRPNGFPIYV